ncbi:MAG: bifunctional diaminohydroxyphosphoribosylaminopyrimidine deaminase/5-amino-6-(5-phosphoribosylamino)uracil reductase RibD [Candidatus Omnitrophica bacterium]|nr:bifunctional diaminohydroxyphosphoribosylaminopyrimidine deaminase/5-amino-6-(5-phosphoribosylamino)uracil reductase RibD [Candidatus Omnitrophota bacterium]
MELDKKFMRRALELAALGKGRTSPNPMVGAVLVKDGRIVGEGYHRRCGGDHAEVAAFKAAGPRAAGATLYVNLEPCFHWGYTPPCVEAVIKSGAREVVIGMSDPNSLTNGKSIAKLRSQGVKVRVGVLRREAERLNEVFIKNMKQKMPFVAVKFAQTLDGKIATAAGKSKWITSDAARAFARRIRNEYDAILCGRRTVKQDDPGLNAGRRGKRIKKIIMDPAFKTSLSAKLFAKTQPQDCWLAVTQQAPLSRRKRLAELGVNVLVCPEKRGEIDLIFLFKQLASAGICSILVEGGAATVGRVLKAGLADKVYAYVAPKILGDQQALSSVTGLDIRDLPKAIVLKQMTVRSIGKDFLFEAYV